MSMLTCPVCQGAMKEVNRNGVLIDTCTQCRGVWLDRGELEKIAAMVGPHEAGPQTQAGFVDTSRSRPAYDRRRDDDDDDRDWRKTGGSSGGRRKSFLDFFD